jgi:hypothetical protein
MSKGGVGEVVLEKGHAISPMEEIVETIHFTNKETNGVSCWDCAESVLDEWNLNTLHGWNDNDGINEVVR